jgi:hypothetical protein
MAWKLTNVELKQVANCELDTLHPYLACDRTPDGLIDCQPGEQDMKNPNYAIQYWYEITKLTLGIWLFKLMGRNKFVDWLNGVDEDPCDNCGHRGCCEECLK